MKLFVFISNQQNKLVYNLIAYILDIFALRRYHLQNILTSYDYIYDDFEFVSAKAHVVRYQ